VVGSGTGYSAAVLRAIGLRCCAGIRSGAGIRRREGVETVVGELATGWAKGRPYDLILLDGAVEEVPGSLVKQLRDGRLAGRSSTVACRACRRPQRGRRRLRAIADADVDAFLDSNGHGPSLSDIGGEHSL
jgi:protein-L-isoaspartate(D-aspartate) O-methyltransferase